MTKTQHKAKLTVRLLWVIDRPAYGEGDQFIQRRAPELFFGPAAVALYRLSSKV